MKTYRVSVKPKSKQKLVEHINPNHLIVKLTQSPQKGKANKQLITLIADFFHIRPNKVKLIKGHSQSQKIITIDD